LSSSVTHCVLQSFPTRRSSDLALLGGATMALQNSDDFAPLRVGVGVGTLYGIGLGIIDISRISKAQKFYLSGAFNDATNSAVIPLLDTLYGAAGGALIASSVAL